MTSTNHALVERVTALMKNQGLNRHQLANLSGINYDRLGRRLGGQSPLTVPEVEALANALTIPVPALFDKSPL